MSGEQSCVVDINMKYINNIIDSQNSRVGLKNYIYNPEVDTILGLDSSQLKNISAAKCGEYAFILSQFALYVQLESNKYKIISDWCENSINRLLSKEYNNYGDKWTPYEVKKGMFINGNDTGKKLIDVKKEYATKLEAWSNIANSIKFMSDKLTELQRSKKRDYGN